MARRLTQAIDCVPHRTYAESFVGMGGVFLRRGRRPTAEVINDWSTDVATFFRILQRHYVPFCDMLRFQITSRLGFEQLLKLDPSTLTDLERAARFLYLQRLAFGGKVSGHTFGVDPNSPGAFDPTRIGPTLEAIHERLAGVTIERLPWLDFVPRYDREETLFYLDPPYFGCEDDYGAGMFDRRQFVTMADVLERLSGRFILSLNDHPEVRRIFAAFEAVRVELLYSVGGGDNTSEAAELIISKLPADPLTALFLDCELAL